MVTQSPLQSTSTSEMCLTGVIPGEDPDCSLVLQQRTFVMGPFLQNILQIRTTEWFVSRDFQVHFVALPVMGRDTFR